MIRIPFIPIKFSFYLLEIYKKLPKIFLISLIYNTNFSFDIKNMFLLFVLFLLDIRILTLNLLLDIMSLNAIVSFLY